MLQCKFNNSEFNNRVPPSVGWRYLVLGDVYRRLLGRMSSRCTRPCQGTAPAARRCTVLEMHKIPRPAACEMPSRFGRPRSQLAGWPAGVDGVFARVCPLLKDYLVRTLDKDPLPSLEKFAFRYSDHELSTIFETAQPLKTTQTQTKEKTPAMAKPVLKAPATPKGVQKDITAKPSTLKTPSTPGQSAAAKELAALR